MDLVMYILNIIYHEVMYILNIIYHEVMYILNIIYHEVMYINYIYIYFVMEHHLKTHLAMWGLEPASPVSVNRHAML